MKKLEEKVPAFLDVICMKLTPVKKEKSLYVKTILVQCPRHRPIPRMRLGPLDTNRIKMVFNKRRT